MRCSYGASIAEPVDRVWAALSDLDRVLAALPGATLTRDADEVAGSLRCAVGSAQITYRVTARATVDQDAHSAVVSVEGSQARGAGTLAATLTVVTSDAAQGCRFEVHGDVEATGRADHADADAWSRVIARLVDGVAAGLDGQAPETARSGARSGEPPKPVEPSGSERPAPRPALSVAPDVDAYAAPAWTARVNLKVIGPVLAGLVLLMRRRRRRRRIGEGVDST